jgi:DNA-binding MarR family transcriptional regulator
MAESDEVSWLDPDEEATWLRLIGVVVRLPAALDAQLRRDAGLSHFEYMVLAALSMADGASMRMSDIAEFAESSLSRLSHACKRLEAQGWLTRYPDPADGRATVATLTAKGRAKVVEAAPGHVRTVRALVFDPLNRAQVKQVGDAMARIEAAISATGIAPPSA